MREREQGFLGKWFCEHPNEANSLSKRGRSQFGKLRPLGMSTGVDLRGRKGVMERVVDGKDGTELAPSDIVWEGEMT